MTFGLDSAHTPGGYKFTVGGEGGIEMCSSNGVYAYFGVLLCVEIL